MKTPREILLKRHQSAGPKLDKLRREVVSTALSHPRRAWHQCVGRGRLLPVCAALAVWRELIWPCRRVWAGTAALWVVIIAVNFLNLEESEPTQSGGGSSSAAFATFLAEQQRLLAELGDTAPSPPQPPPAAQRPRSEYQRANYSRC